MRNATPKERRNRLPEIKKLLIEEYGMPEGKFDACILKLQEMGLVIIYDYDAFGNPTDYVLDEDKMEEIKEFLQE